MKDAKAWLKKIQAEESFAKKYKGLSNVESIMLQAKKDGYHVNKEDLKNVDLKKIAGGAVTVKVINQKVDLNILATGDRSKAKNSSNITMYGEN